jgi:hypothetical protein
MYRTVSTFLVTNFPILRSSVNSAEVSLTVRGLGVYIIPLMVWYFQIDEMTASKLFQGIVSFIDTASALIGSAMVIYGLIRKIK